MDPNLILLQIWRSLGIPNFQVQTFTLILWFWLPKTVVLTEKVLPGAKKRILTNSHNTMLAGEAQFGVDELSQSRKVVCSTYKATKICVIHDTL